jgi:gliding motility-associated-like protein
MRLATFTFSLCFFLSVNPDLLKGQQNDCSGAEVICSDGAIAFTPTGPGNDDFANPNNNDGCLSGEHQSAWYYFEFNTNMPANSVIEFTINPNAGPGQDYDFAVFGPDVECNNLGSPIRCSWAAASCGFCPQTGLGMGATDNSEGAGGDGFVAPLVVQPGQGYYLLVDNWLSSSSGFSLTWGGSAASFLNCNVDPGCNITVSAGNPQSACAGSTLQLQGSATGTTGAATYSWSGTNGGTAFLNNPLSPTPLVTIPSGFSGTITYTLTVTEGACSETATVTVTVGPVPTPAISGNLSICQGQFTTVFATPGFTSYQWSNGGSGVSTTVGAPGAISVTVTNSAGCQGVATVNVTQEPAPQPVITGDLTVCQGGTATLDAGFGFDSYAWSNGGTGQTNVVTQGGIYTVTVTNAAGCPGTAQVTVLNAPGPEPAITGSPVACPGQPVVLNAGPGFSTYTWSNNTFNQTTTVNGPGQYSVTVTDVNGCIGFGSFQVAAIPPLTPSITGNLSICPGEPTTLNAGPGYSSYQWSDNSSGQTITVNAPGVYSVTVTNADGCSGVANATVTTLEPPTPSIFGNLSVCPGEATELTASPGFFSYLWSDNSTGPSIQAGAGSHSVTVTDNNGCLGVATVFVTQADEPAPAIFGDTQICAGESTTLGVAAGFSSYLWSSGQTGPSITTSVPGDYSVTVTNASGCQGIAGVTVQLSDPPEPSISGPAGLCPNSSGALNAGGGFSSYAWSTNQTGQSITVNTAGTYTVTVTNAEGCEGTASFTVSATSPPTPAITGTLSFCSGQSTSLDAGAGYSSYLWSNGQTGQSITVSSGGEYSVEVTNAGGCSGTASVTVSMLDNPQPAISGDADFCAGSSTTLDAGSGYSGYQWSTTDTGQYATVSAGGIYTVTVTNTDGCSEIASISVTQLPNPTPNITGETQICPDGATTLNAGAGFAEYLWSNSGTNQQIDVNTGGIYSVTVTDAAGCWGVAQTTVTYLNEPQPVITGNTQLCEGETTTLNAGGGYATYLWSDNSSLPSITVMAGGEYSVTVTNADGCAGTATATVQAIAPVEVNIQGETSFCQGSSTLLDAGAGFNSYLWSNGLTGQTITATAPGTYSVVATYGNGCTAEDEIEINADLLPQPQITGLLNFCEGGSTNLGLSQTYSSYIWSNTSATPTVNINTPGSISVTVTDDNGCSAVATANVQELQSLQPQILGDLSFCQGESAMLEGEPGYTSYVWSNGMNGSTVSISAPGTISLSVTDANGCSGSSSVVLTQNSLPQPAISGELIFCQGESTALDAGASYAAYQWSNNETGQQISVDQPGFYEVTVTDGNGCEGYTGVQVVEQAPPQPQILGVPNFCPGTSTTLSADGTYNSYSWSGGSTSASIEVNTPGDYFLAVTDALGCVGEISIAVAEYAVADPVISGPPAFCPGESAQLSAGAGFEEYYWSNNSAAQTITVNNPGAYSVTVTDINGCQTMATASVDVFTVVAPAITGDTDFCAGETVTLDAGTGYTDYLWSNSETTQTATIASGGDYTVTVVDGNGCSSASSIQVTEYPLPQVTIGGSTSFCVGGYTTLNAGGAYVDYLWSNGSDAASIQVNTPGTYGLTVTNANGCVGTAQIGVVEDTELNPVITGAFEYCENGSTVIDAGEGYATYAWSNGSTGQTLEVNQPGTYAVTVTDAGGCIGNTEVSVVENPLPEPVIQGVASFCAGESTSLNAGAGYTNYQWSTGIGTASITVDQPGQYSVVVTDADGCSAGAMVDVEEHPLPVFAVSGQDFFCENETTTLSVPASFSEYLWSNGGQGASVTVGQAQQYTVTVTNEFGCSDSRSVDIEEIALPQADAGEDQNIDCEVLSVVLGGGGSSQGNAFAYEWSGPGIAAGQVNLSFPEVNVEGVYSLVVTDTIHGCASQTATATVSDLAYDPQVDLQVMDMLDCTTSTVTIDGSGSESGPYIVYQWYDENGELIPGAESFMLETNLAGIYYLRVSDITTGCWAMESAKVEEDRQYPAAVAGLPQHLDCKIISVQLDGSASADGPEITYAWTTADGYIISGADTPNPLVGQPGTYVITVMNNLNGCSNTAQVLVTQDINAPTADAGPDQELDCNTPTITLDGGGSSNGGNITFEWSLNGNPSFNQNGKTISVDAPGIYTLLVTNQGNGCSDTDVVVVTENEAAPDGIELLIQEPTCFDDRNGSILIENVAGGTPPFLYSMNGGPFGNLSSFTGISAGIYNLTVQDATGCEYETSITVNPGNDLAIDLGDDLYIDLGQTVDIQALVNIPEEEIASFGWITRDEVSCPDCLKIQVGPLRTTTYGATVTDENGCLATDEMTIFVNRPYDIFIPNVFSPNNDGNNDIFMIFGGADVEKIHSFQVFNRWGEIVFEVFNFPPNDPTYGWDGNYRARKYNSAVLVYFAEVEFIDGEVVLFKGDVVLMR